MNKLIAIIATIVVNTAAWVLCNVIALGVTANYHGVVTVGVVSGIVIGIACLVFKSVNPIITGIGTTLGAYVGIAALFIGLGVAHMPEINLELAKIICVMTLIGATSGFAYKLIAR